MTAIDIANNNLWLMFEFLGEPFYVTQSFVSLWIVMGVLILLSVIVRVRLKTFKEIPSGFQNFVELTVEMMSNLAKDNMGPRLEKMGAYFYVVFAFILLSNWSGLFGLRPPTADLATTAAFGIGTFVLIHALGIKEQKGAYVKDFFSPNPLLMPLNLIGELSKPISLSFRLFGNLLGGMIIVGTMYAMMPLPATVILPNIAHIWFDIFVGFLQTFIFVMLSMTFIQQKAFVQ